MHAGCHPVCSVPCKNVEGEAGHEQDKPTDFVPRWAIAGCILPVIPFAPCLAQGRRRSAAVSSTTGESAGRVLPRVRVRPLPGEACGAVARQRQAHADRPNAESRITAGQRATCSWRSSSASDPHALLTCGCGAASVFACSGGGRARMDSAKASGARSRPSPRWPHMQHRK